jgi:hypothetical protein
LASLNLLEKNVFEATVAVVVHGLDFQQIQGGQQIT